MGHPNARTGRDALQASDIRISILSDHEWRICDRRIPETNAECVLGYIDKTAGVVDMVGQLRSICQPA